MTLTEIYDIWVEQCEQKICTDTRKIESNSMFFALKGEQFNGNRYAQKAIDNGCKMAIVDEVEFANNSQIILVDNVLETLQKLSNLHRKNMSAKIIGIGGSNGKTTTKELLFYVFSTTYKTQCTQGNFNNHIGVPLTLLSIKEDTEIMFVELGTNQPGDINELCSIAEPEFGIITNIGKEHLMGFGTIEGVARAESELYDYLIRNKGTAFVNMDDKWLENMSKRIDKKIPYEINKSDIKVMELVPHLKFKLNNTEISSSLMGKHNLQNIVATISLAQYFNITDEKIKFGIEIYNPSNNRSQWINTDKGNQVLLDAYNANPSSVEAIIDTLKPVAPKTVLVLGDMYELGDFEKQEHENIINYCQKFNFFDIIFVGEIYSKAAKGQNLINFFKDKKEAETFIISQKYFEKIILIKGSRGMKMETFLDFF